MFLLKLFKYEPQVSYIGSAYPVIVETVHVIYRVNPNGAYYQAGHTEEQLLDMLNALRVARDKAIRELLKEPEPTDCATG